MTDALFDLDALERVAREATSGPWLYGPLESSDRTWTLSLAPEGKGAAVVAEVFSEDDRDFMAALNPSVVLSLISRLRASDAREREAWIAGRDAAAVYVGDLWMDGVPVAEMAQRVRALTLPEGSR